MTALPLGFGVSGTHGTPLVSRSSTIAMIERSFDLGVRLFDTAPAYGAGEAERRLGAAISAIGREKVRISTKAGLSSAGLARRIRDFSPGGIEASVTASLERLGVEGVDLLWLHGADGAELTGTLLDRLDALRRAGAFARLGAAGRGAELDAALDTGRFEALMAPVHPFLDEVESARLARAKALGLEVHAIETAGDAPSGVSAPRSAADLYKLAKVLRARLSGVSGRGRVSHADGLRAALARPEIDLALVTTTRPGHLVEAIEIAAAAARRADGRAGADPLNPA
ncbi:MAG: aldo/keto reductase [Oceanicaulis sp.]